MNKAELVAAVSERSGLPSAQVRSTLDTVIDVVSGV
ncbi:HU family DNA-binding protein, partial [Phenylobacterium sp.]